MAGSIRDTIKTYFQTGDVPTQAQFYEWLDNILFSDEFEASWFSYLETLLLTGFDPSAATDGLPNATNTTFEALEKIVKHVGDNMPLSQAEFVADSGSVSTAETDLYTAIIDAQTLVNVGDKLIVHYAIFLKGSASSKQIKLKVGLTNVVFDTTALPVGSDTNVMLTGFIMKTDTNKIRVALNIVGIASNIAEFSPVDWNTPQNIILTGQASGGGAANDDVLAKSGYILLVKAAA